MERIETLEVSELFYSIQGESTFAGLPCVFIRLSGCNLRCSYCDATYSFEEKGKKTKLESLHQYIAKYPGSLIEITGGEPLLQSNTILLLQQLVGEKKEVLLETNGSMDIGSVPIETTIIMDIKCPDSNSGSSFLETNLDLIRDRFTLRPGSSEIKFVISSKKDYDWAKSIVLENSLQRYCPVLFSPVNGRMEYQELAEQILEDQLAVRLQLQLHTFIWPEIVRGV